MTTVLTAIKSFLHAEVLSFKTNISYIQYIYICKLDVFHITNLPKLPILDHKSNSFGHLFKHLNNFMLFWQTSCGTLRKLFPSDSQYPFLLTRIFTKNITKQDGNGQINPFWLFLVAWNWTTEAGNRRTLRGVRFCGPILYFRYEDLSIKPCRVCCDVSVFSKISGERCTHILFLYKIPKYNNMSSKEKFYQCRTKHVRAVKRPWSWISWRIALKNSHNLKNVDV